jgi:membrane carboxypeptidase/penicillin-binding protein
MVPELRKAGMINGLQTDATPFDSLVMMAPTDAIKTQAQFLARQYQKGMIDDEKANTLAQQMLTMSTAHMDRQQQMQFQQGMQGLMMGMRQESQQQARERLDMQKEENAKKLTDEQKITYRSIVTPIINEGIKASTALASLGALQKIAQDAPSGYISGAYAKSVGALFNTDDNTALRELEALQKSLLTQIPRLPGSQSNFDAKNLEKSLGDLTDITMDNKQRLALISKIQQQFQRMQDRANEVQDTWESTKKLPKWTSERAPATGTPAPATTGPVVDFSALPSRRP